MSTLSCSSGLSKPPLGDPGPPRSRRPLRRPVLLRRLVLGCVVGAGIAPPPGHARDWTADLDRLDAFLEAERSEAALSLADSLLATPAAGQDQAARMRILLRQGAVWAATGSAFEADSVLTHVEQWAKQAGDTLSWCACLRWRGLSLGALGRHREAADACQALLGLARRARLPRYEGWALVGLAWEEQCRGKPERAAELLERAVLAFTAAGDQRGEAWARNGLGLAWQRLGRYRLAQRAYEVSSDLARSTRYAMLEGMAVTNLANLQFALGDPGAAAASYQKVLEIRGEAGHPAERVVPAINLAHCWVAMGRPRAAEDSMDSLLRYCRERGQRDLEATVRSNYVEILAGSGRHARARRLGRELLRSEAAASAAVRLRTWLALSRSLADSDSLAAALALLRSGERLLRSLPHDEFAHHFALELGEVLLRAGEAQEALSTFRAAERKCREQRRTQGLPQALDGMARSLRQLGRIDSAAALLDRAIDAWEVNREVPLDPEWREQRGAAGRSIWSEFADVELERSGCGATPAGSPDLLQAGGDRVSSAGGVLPQDRQIRVRHVFDHVQRYKTRTLLERIRGLEPVDPAETPMEATLDRLQEGALRPGEILLDYLAGPRVSFLFAVTVDDLQVIRLPSESVLAARCRLYRELLTRPSSGARPMADSTLVGAAHGLCKMILGEACDRVAASHRVYVSPDGPLNLLPMADLPVLLGWKGASAKEWARIPSAAFLLRARRLPPGPATPDSPATPAAPRAVEPWNASSAGIVEAAGLALLGMPQGSRAMPGLHHEVDRLSHLYKNIRVFTVSARDSVPHPADLFRKIDVVHIAAHAVVDDERPWRSRIELAAGEAGGLRAEDMARTRAPLRLAVLSGCETAGGRILNGEGVLGLTAAFLAGGSDAVVASLWPVDDRATALLMDRFYLGLSRGWPAATALAQAQRELRSRAETRHPFFWAGFTVTGNADVRLNLTRRRTGRGPILAIAAGAAAILIAVIRPGRGSSRPRGIESGARSSRAGRPGSAAVPEARGKAGVMIPRNQRNGADRAVISRPRRRLTG